MENIVKQIKSLSLKISQARRFLDLEKKKISLKDLEYQLAEKDFWQDRESAERVSREFEELKKEVATWENIHKDTEELLELAQEAISEKAHSLEKDIEKKYNTLQQQFAKLEFFILLAGKYDQRNAIFAIHAGTGGVDAQDWAEILLRMYLRYCEKRGWRVKILDKSMGNEAGIKSVTFEVIGKYAFGFLKSENGVHRLVRISPYDAEKMRHTSFALAEVIPELGELEDIKIEPKDLRIDTFLSSGHGGQSVQTTYSAVRIVHLPTKITVTCQNERSQRQNKETALKILKSKLILLEEKEKQKEKQKLRGEFHEAAWGNQIRSYVMQPYKMVKDHRTKFETQDVDSVLDGRLEGFIESYLKMK
ncbi:MAG: peptide chain release factor 2 [Patescibacteria group bacterium]